MSRKLRIGLVTLLVVGALSAAMSGTVLAQEDTPEAEAVPELFAMRHFGRGLGGEVGLEAAAEALGMTADELSLQLWGGESLADLADAAGVDLQTVQDAVNAALEQAQRDAIEQAVEDGLLTREHADWLLEGLANGYWGGHGFHGFGGHRGMRGLGEFSGLSRFQAPATPSTDGTGL